MASEKSIAAFLGVVASFVSAFGFWGSAAFSPSVMLTFLTVPLGIYCGVAGARKSAFITLYFAVAAWAPHVAPRGSTFDFGTGWLALFGAGLFFSFVLICYQVLYVRATQPVKAARTLRAGTLKPLSRFATTAHGVATMNWTTTALIAIATTLGVTIVQYLSGTLSVFSFAAVVFAAGAAVVLLKLVGGVGRRRNE